MGIDARLLNGKPRVMLLESFDDEVTVIGPGLDGLKRFKHQTVEDAVKSIEARGWVVGTSFLHGSYGKESKKEESNNGSHNERNARPSGEKNQEASF